MSLDIITKKIVDDANDFKRETLKEAKREAEEIIKEANIEAERIINEQLEKTLAEKERMITRRQSIINVDSRKLILEKKQEIIQGIFKEANVSYEDNKRELLSEVSKMLF